MKQDNTVGNGAVQHKKHSRMGEHWRIFRKNRPAMVGLVILILLLLVACFADVIADYETQAIGQNRHERLETPSSEHWFGTDALGRDVLARVVHGSRLSLAIGFGAMAVSLIVGGTLGAVTGYYGGKVDAIIMRLIDIIMSVPSMLLAIAIVTALGPSMSNLMIAMMIGQIPRFARVVRSMMIGAAQEEYVEAAKVGGATNTRIIIRHILPNIVGPIIVQATMSVASLILTSAGLSFIGLGVQAPAPEWGTMLSEARDFMLTDPYLVIVPGLAIALTVFSLNTIGDGLRDAFDPRMKD